MAALVVATAALTCYADNFDLQREDIRRFVTRMQDEHGLDVANVEAVLADARRKDSILEAISRPAEKRKPWYEYREIFLNEKRIDGGAAFWSEHAASLAQVSRQTGVPAQIIVAIIGVETNYGRITGRYRVLDALSTLAFDYPPRSTFFTSELEHFLLLTREEDVEVLSALGSYAGAMGAAQFMPSSYRRYASDGDDDGQRDLWGSWDDVFASIANYFLAHGWQPGKPAAAAAQVDAQTTPGLASTDLSPGYRLSFLRDNGVRFTTSLDDDDVGGLIPFETADGEEHIVGFHNFYVITRYNRSRLYARSVLNLGEAIAARVEQNH
jgi:membrane-bound lytic murein transglycosylase B